MFTIKKKSTPARGSKRATIRFGSEEQEEYRGRSPVATALAVRGTGFQPVSQKPGFFQEAGLFCHHLLFAQSLST
jgi:hypothetical protein